jgi:hypothetical protein
VSFTVGGIYLDLFHVSVVALLLVLAVELGILCHHRRRRKK